MTNAETQAYVINMQCAHLDANRVELEGTEAQLRALVAACQLRNCT
jgi:hypothetical protein